MGGTLTLTRTCRPDSVQPACGFGTVIRWGVVLCTLLGPEGPGRWIFGCIDRTFWTSSAVMVSYRVGEEYRPYFENYTVDASILKMQTK